MIFTTANADSSCYRCFSVIVPLPLFTIEGRLSENLINHFRVISGTERYHRTKGGICFGMRAITADVTLVEKLAKLLAVLLFAQTADEVEGNSVTVTAFAVFLLFGSAHIFVKRRKNGIGGFLERLLPNHIPGKYSKAICKTTDVKLQAILGIFYVKCAVELFLTFFISNKGQLASVALSVNMDTATADRTLRI